MLYPVGRRAVFGMKMKKCGILYVMLAATVLTACLAVDGCSKLLDAVYTVLDGGAPAPVRTTEYFKRNPGSTRALELVLTVSGGIVTKVVWEYAP